MHFASFYTPCIIYNIIILKKLKCNYFLPTAATTDSESVTATNETDSAATNSESATTTSDTDSAAATDSEPAAARCMIPLFEAPQIPPSSQSTPRIEYYIILYYIIILL